MRRQNFHLGALGAAHVDADQHRREMELHRLNAEPRMTLEVEAWSNLNDGGPDPENVAQV